MEEPHLAGQIRQAGASEFEIPWIGIKPDERTPWSEAFAKGTRVPAAPDSAIDDQLVGLRVEPLQDLLLENRLMAGVNAGRCLRR